jgi:hypothetical protein
MKDKVLNTLIVTSTLPSGTFDIFKPLCFMFGGGELFYISAGKTAVLPQDDKRNLNFSWFQEKTAIFSNDIISNSIEISNYIFIQSYDEETEIWKKINKRLTYLDKISGEQESNRKYQSTKLLLLDVLRCFKLKKQPLIGIDDNGQIGAEWHNGHNFKIISIVPRREDNISFSIIKKNGTMLHIQNNLALIKNHSVKELSTALGEISW